MTSRSEPALVGWTLRVQVFAISPLARNGLFATTPSHEFRFSVP